MHHVDDQEGREDHHADHFSIHHSTNAFEILRGWYISIIDQADTAITARSVEIIVK